MARIRSPSWPPNDSSTIPLQSSSPDAQRKTEGMNPAWTPTGTRRWRARWASYTVSATRMSWSSFRLRFGRFRRNTRAMAGSPDRASSINAEQIAAASGAETSLKTPCATNSATRSSLSWRRLAMSRPFDSSFRSRTAPNCSKTSTTRRNSCQYALRSCSSCRRRTPSRSATVSSSRHSRSQRAVAPHGQRCRPEDPLDHSALHPHGDPVRQERVDEHAATADRMDAEHHREGRRPAAPDQHETPRLRLRDGALSTPRPAAQRLTTRLDLLARAPVAADALKVAARCGVAPQLLERGLESVDVGLDLTNALEILILAERRLDAPVSK